MTSDEVQPELAADQVSVRRLFLDDDQNRATRFLDLYPDAIWVETVPDCIAKLAESWDEVHLDHDLGGEVYVDILRPDCGMEVVRWLVTEPRPHLKQTKFTIHSWNASAAIAMLWHLEALGYQVVAQPFGQRQEEGEPQPDDPPSEELEFVYTYEPDPPTERPVTWWKRVIQRWFPAKVPESEREELPNRPIGS